MTRLTVRIEFDGQLDEGEIAKVISEIKAGVDGVESVAVVTCQCGDPACPNPDIMTATSGS